MLDREQKTEKHIENFSCLAKFIENFLHEKTTQTDKRSILLTEAIRKSSLENGFFTEFNIRFALDAIATMLSPENLNKWISAYKNQQNNQDAPKTIGVVMAGNIPMVGFHDFLCVLFSGNKFLGKASQSDKYLIQALAEILFEIDADYKEFITFTSERLENFDAVIATGSNNTARYFEYYFGKYPHIIRKNRNSIALLTGNETLEQLTLLAQDIFIYFGLGCRNITKLFVPQNYNFSLLIEACNSCSGIINHHKYKNNYDYYKTIFIMNNQAFIDAEFFLMQENTSMHNPISILNYEFYVEEKTIQSFITSQAEHLQCIVGNNFKIDGIQNFGTTQNPNLWDYADDVDTMKFLLNL